MFGQPDTRIVPEEAYESDTYSDGPIKRIKCFIFSTVRGMGHQKRKKDGNEDVLWEVDLKHIKTHFTDFYPKSEVYIENQLCQRANNFSDFIFSLKSDVSLNSIDCIFFIFLTFVTQDGKLKLSGKDMTLNEIVDEVKHLLTDSPKVILVQADDVRLLRDKVTYKGDVKFVKKKVPTDADVLQIVSNIPGEFARHEDPNSPSLLIKTFCDIMSETAKQPDDSKEDLLSLTVEINRRIDAEIAEIMGKENLAELPWKRTPDLEVPLVTSTLRRNLIITR